MTRLWFLTQIDFLSWICSFAAWFVRTLCFRKLDYILFDVDWWHYNEWIQYPTRGKITQIQWITILNTKTKTLRLKTKFALAISWTVFILRVTLIYIHKVQTYQILTSTRQRSWKVLASAFSCRFVTQLQNPAKPFR